MLIDICYVVLDSMQLYLYIFIEKSYCNEV